MKQNVKSDKFYNYKITNLINNKIYIGKTSGEDPENRFYAHKMRPYYNCSKDDCPKLYRSIRKYGIENFSFEVLQTFDNEDVAYDAEEKLIEKYDSIKKGMNTVKGGKGASCGEQNPMYNKGYLIAGSKNGMFGMTGAKNPFFGRKHSDKTIADMRQQKRKLSNDDILAIKEMILNKVNYKIISKQFNIVASSISRIKFNLRYTEVGTEYKFNKYNRKFTEEDVESILKLWLKSPITINGHIQIKSFYDNEIKNKFSIQRHQLSDILNGKTYRHIYDRHINSSSHPYLLQT